jgi:DNA-binding response OmpR family regulator
MQQQDTTPAQPTDSDGAQANDLKPRVLVIDDDVSLSRLVRAILRTADFEVAQAYNGLEGLEVASREHPDVIVLDLQMPQMDGRGFFRELRARGDLTPVLVSSSYGARSAQQELGAEGSIEKPFDPDALVAAVARLFQGTRMDSQRI